MGIEDGVDGIGAGTKVGERVARVEGQRLLAVGGFSCVNLTSSLVLDTGPTSLLV